LAFASSRSVVGVYAFAVFGSLIGARIASVHAAGNSAMVTATSRPVYSPPAFRPATTTWPPAAFMSTPDTAAPVAMRSAASVMPVTFFTRSSGVSAASAKKRCAPLGLWPLIE